MKPDWVCENCGKRTDEYQKDLILCAICQRTLERDDEVVWTDIH